jgi:dihydropteroate synthase
MSRDNPLSQQRLLYIGEISEPPQWLPVDTRAAIAPICAVSHAGVFCLENPTAEQTQYLETVAGKHNGVVSVLKAGEAEICVYVGSPAELCTGQSGRGAPMLDGSDFSSALERYSRRKFTLALREKSLTLGDRTKVMGILNVTPDSFSDGGKFHAFDTAVAHAEKMAEDGADIIDIGGESTRPGSAQVSIDEEAERVLPVVEHLAKNLSIPISIDTCKAEIARRAVDSGAEIINDISALRFDPQMINVARESGCPIILMHMQQTPKDMQQDPRYDALMPEIICFLSNRIDQCVKDGIDPGQIIVDPGIGFGKTVEHNLEIIRELEQLQALGCPILIGTSRKATIGAVLDAEVENRIEGTAATVAVSIAKNAHIVRVHDVEEMSRVAKMTDAIMGKDWN